MYERYFHQWIRRTSDGAIIPVDPQNADFQAFQAWESQGNTPQPYTPNGE